MEKELFPDRKKKADEICVVLAGNPNSGKTTIFNDITGARQKVGNWGGVTVEVKEGKTSFQGRTVHVVDLPGTYSLTAYSMEEIAAREYIVSGEADVVIDVVDSTNLERNLFLGVQLMEMGRPMVFAFNMSDEAEKKGIEIDVAKLEKLLDAPIQQTVGRVGKGIDDLVEKAVRRSQGDWAPPHEVKINYGPEIEEEIEHLCRCLRALEFDPGSIPLRWFAVKLLEDDHEIRKKIRGLEGASSTIRQLAASKAHLKDIFADDVQTVISERRYGFIHGAIQQAVRVRLVHQHDVTHMVDKVLTNRWLAFPIFGLFMYLLFQATFKIGGIPMGWIETGVGALKGLVHTLLPASVMRSLLADGIISGVGGVIIFLPNIMILFFGISLLEDTGYMARAAFIMDKIMHGMGLHGKSFIPMIMGLGCNVPAIMAARTLESKKDRILTILVAPLITCSARLPVYVLFAGALFPGHAGNIVFLMYLLSFAFSFAAGFVMRKVLFRGEEHPFVMELPPYRVPTPRSVFIHMWEKGKHYLQKMGGVVLVFSVILWFLTAFPKGTEISREYDAEIAAVQKRMSHSVSPDEKKSQIRKMSGLENQKYAAVKKNTYIGRLGAFIEPVLRPAGFDWRMGVALISGFVAKEVVVSTLGILFNVGEVAGQAETPADTVKHRELRTVLRETYSPLQGFAFMLFVLLYTPCVVALVTLMREVKSVGWSLFSLGYQVLLAWIMAVGVYQAGRLLGL